MVVSVESLLEIKQLTVCVLEARDGGKLGWDRDSFASSFVKGEEAVLMHA
jgi:hypothetical protein